MEPPVHARYKSYIIIVIIIIIIIIIIISDIDQLNRRLWERVWTRKKIWRNFLLCLSLLVEHDPFLEGVFSHT